MRCYAIKTGGKRKPEFSLVHSFIRRSNVSNSCISLSVFKLYHFIVSMGQTFPLYGTELKANAVVMGGGGGGRGDDWDWN